MSYQVLARKWRPQTFADVVGQEHVLTALANGLSLGRIHHAYLFSGTRGVGKTSIARLLAKGLNCETGITATPCGVCDNCREIEQGRFVDLIEIDAASRTKVEDTRDLLDNVQYAPARGRFKVYLIDEVHMLSRHSFNALLKTLEEPPAHVKFLLATTDPQKLPVTILSRCLQFHLKALDVEQIRHQLEHILGEEQIAFEPRALQLLSRAADGSLRDALSLTDQAIASGEGQLTAASVSTMLGTLDDDQALSLIEPQEEVEARGSVFKNQLLALRNPALWTLALASAFMYIDRYAVNSWGIFFLEQDKAYSTLEASGIIGVNAIAGIAGTIIAGMLSDRFFPRNRSVMAGFISLLNTAGFALMLWSPHNYYTDILAMIIFGATIGALTCFLGGLIAVDISSRKAAGAALGTIGIASYAGAGLGEFLTGIIIDKTAILENGKTLYDFSTLALFWVGTGLGSALLCFTTAAIVARRHAVERQTSFSS
nr:DNA polymerase III subunit gamma/tau [Klebsiella pneumoniae]